VTVIVFLQRLDIAGNCRENRIRRSIQCRRLTDRQRDGRTPLDSTHRAIQSIAQVKNMQNFRYVIIIITCISRLIAALRSSNFSSYSVDNWCATVSDNFTGRLHLHSETWSVNRHYICQYDPLIDSEYHRDIVNNLSTRAVQTVLNRPFDINVQSC